MVWDDGASDGEEETGYTLERETSGILHVRACESRLVFQDRKVYIKILT